MKWIIYALLLANLAFGLWHYRSQELASVKAPSTDDDTLRLVLVKEFLNQKQAKPAASTQTAESETSPVCYTLGPFKSADDANAVRDLLKPAGIAAKRHMSKDNSRKGLWVLLPPESTRSQARQHIDALKEHGIKDYFLVVTGDQTNAVSLGVFAQTDTAQRRYDEIKALGFSPKILNVDLPQREYWLDWPVEQSVSADVLEKIRKQYNGVGQTQRNCSNG